MSLYVPKNLVNSTIEGFSRMVKHIMSGIPSPSIGGGEGGCVPLFSGNAQYKIESEKKCYLLIKYSINMVTCMLSMLYIML